MAEKAIYPLLGKIFLWLVNVVLAFAGIACLMLGVVTLWHGADLVAAGTGLTAGLVFLFSATIDRFESLKGLGVEARTRKLDEAISQANATVDQLRELAELSSGFVVSLSAKAGRWDSAPTLRESHEIAQRVRRNLKSLGSSEPVIRETLAPWVSIVIIDQVREVLKEVRRPLLLAQEHYSQKLQAYPTPIAAGDPEYQALLDQRNKYGAYEGTTFGDVSDWPAGTHVNTLRRMVRSMPLVDESDREKLKTLIAPWLPRLEYLVANNDLSDKEEWFAEDERVSASPLSQLR